MINNGHGVVHTNALVENGHAVVHTNAILYSEHGSDHTNGQASLNSDHSVELALSPYDFDQRLIKLNDEMGSDDIVGLVFVCRDHLPANKLVKAKSALEIFGYMKDAVLISVNNLDFLLECLARIHRYDLISKLGWDSDAVREALPNLQKVSPYRVLLMDLVDDVDDADFTKIRIELKGRIKKKMLNEQQTLMQLLVLMEQEGLLGPTNITLLQKVIENIARPELVKRILDYIDVRDRYFDTGQHDPAAVTTDPAGSSQASQVPSALSLENDAQISVVDGNASVQSEELECYNITRIPRGLCIIINNEKFHIADVDEHYRMGSAKDAESLRNTFERLGFSVRRYDNLSDSEMKGKLGDAAHNENHTAFDCFVCCILTHGVGDSLFGVNMRKIPVKELTSIFQTNSCPSLAGKPKLFFIQACRNELRDCPEHDGPEPFYDNEVTTLQKEVLPNESDFLLGYSTSPGNASFRSPSNGSWYISTLCDMLLKHADRHDILTILTSVNNAVSNKNDGGYKQVPAPLFTLRKRLFLMPV